MLEAIDHATVDSELSGYIIDFIKISKWKQYVVDGMEWRDLFEIIQADREKVIAIRPQPEHRDSLGVKHIGNVYFISGDDPEDPPVK